MPISLTASPKYNGPHACPGCGKKSFWTCIQEMPVVVIRIECDGDCGTYEKPYSELESEPFFEKQIRITME
jgi:hypothetical protein